MLVLKRKAGESFFIGKEIKVTVVKTEGGKVRIGIEAPREIHIIREELIQETVWGNFQIGGSDNGRDDEDE
jgi:carbon storage regulator